MTPLERSLWTRAAGYTATAVAAFTIAVLIRPRT